MIIIIIVIGKDKLERTSLITDSDELGSSVCSQDESIWDRCASWTFFFDYVALSL